MLSSRDFSVWPVRPGSDTIPAPAVEGGTHEIVFRGSIGTPYPCYGITGHVQVVFDQVSLQIVAAAKPVLCIQVAAAFGYDGRVRNLSPGTYSVRVTHVLDGRHVDMLNTSVTVH